MKKILYAILICTSIATIERPLSARKQVTLASSRLAAKALRIMWNFVRIGASIPTLKFVGNYLLVENPTILTREYLVALITAKKAPTHEIFPLTALGLGGLSTLQNGLLGLKRELWDRKKIVAQANT